MNTIYFLISLAAKNMAEDGYFQIKTKLPHYIIGLSLSGANVNNMTFTVVDKHLNHILNEVWYRIDTSNIELKSWIKKQPTSLWYHIEYTGDNTSYTINEQLYTLLQLTWGH